VPFYLQNAPNGSLGAKWKENVSVSNENMTEAELTVLPVHDPRQHHLQREAKPCIENEDRRAVPNESTDGRPTILRYVASFPPNTDGYVESTTPISIDKPIEPVSSAVELDQQAILLDNTGVFSATNEASENAEEVTVLRASKTVKEMVGQEPRDPGSGVMSVLTEAHKRRQSQVEGMTAQRPNMEKALKFSPSRAQAHISSAESLSPLDIPARVPSSERPQKVLKETRQDGFRADDSEKSEPDSKMNGSINPEGNESGSDLPRLIPGGLQGPPLTPNSPEKLINRPQMSSRLNLAQGSLSSPSSGRSPRHSADALQRPAHANRFKANTSNFEFSSGKLKFDPSMADTGMPSPMPSSIPVPPLSLPTYLQLELSSRRNSSLYIHRPTTRDFPYESSRVKTERLLNFITLPFHLEGALWFGTFACLDCWLYTFTILPLRLLKSFYILGQSWAKNTVAEVQYLSGFIYKGTGRMWQRRQSRVLPASEPALKSITRTSTMRDSADSAPRPAVQPSEKVDGKPDGTLHRNENSQSSKAQRKHRRTKSAPSTLLPDDKADILKGFLIICTSVVLMQFDASRMYHWIRGQAAIKLYVIYNGLEVCDRLFSAIGQDVLECLFSREALERKPDGHSKVLRPFWLFILALVYTVTHATALFYQVITLNVAVNSYSNALITLLMSNQFVEIKSTVFKKFEKENLFQLTCADVVERFQLWLMLTIIASRNIVETGGLNMGFNALSSSPSLLPPPAATNTSHPPTQAMPPQSSSSILPRSFELVPAFINSITAYGPAVSHVLGPFIIVLGSEMLVDWLKHAYVNKFNNMRPAIYGRFLDVLAKDYYSNAFGDQNLTKRLGLPVIPLSCLFIRASVQTYHMFLAAWIPPPVPSVVTALTNMHDHYTASASSLPTSTAVPLSQRFDNLLRQMPATISSSTLFRHLTTVLLVLLGFVVLLAVKLVLGMLLLSFSRSRYRSMKEREKTSIHHVEDGRRVGGWGVVEVDNDKRRWIHEGNAEELKALRDRDERDRVRREKGGGEAAFEKVKRYEMVAKRIW